MYPSSIQPFHGLELSTDMLLWKSDKATYPMIARSSATMKPPSKSFFKLSPAVISMGIHIAYCLQLQFYLRILFRVDNAGSAIINIYYKVSPDNTDTKRKSN